MRVAGVAQAVSALGDDVIDGLELAHTQNNLQLEFFGLDFRPSETLRYQFMLEGADATWSLPTGEHTINYANLRPGTYRFVVRAVTSDGTQSRQPAAVSFTILRPFWQQWWFLVLAALAIMLATHALYRLRLRRLIELERVRTRIATDLHDDIGASMSQIAILSEVAKRRAGDADTPLGDLLTTIAGTSGEMVDSMSDIVWAINPHRDYLSDLTQRMRRFASDTLNARDIDFRFHHFELDKDFQIGADVRREVYLMFKETINNLVKHSHSTEAEIEYRVTDEQLVIEVKDNGKGFDVAAITTASGNGHHHTGMGGHGLASMRRRATELGGIYEIESRVGQGTVVTLRVPLAGNHRLRNMLHGMKSK